MMLAKTSRWAVARRLAFALALLAASHAPGRAASDKCAAPEDVAGTPAALPHVAAALKPGGTLDVLTVGSATVFSPTESFVPGTITARALGLNSGTPSGLVATPTAFPAQMALALQAAYPGTKVNVTVRGGRGMLASEMLDLLRTELAAHHYQMVLWQTGTVEAVRNIPPAQFYQTLADGSAAVADAGADLVLVDPQFSRFLHANAELDPYNQALQQIAAQPGVLLFHRFDLMRYWSNEGQIDLERTPKPQRMQTVETLHACLGQSLGRLVAQGVKAAS